MWDLPEPGIKPMYPALTGRFLTTRPPGKFMKLSFNEAVIFLSVQTTQKRKIAFLNSTLNGICVIALGQSSQNKMKTNVMVCKFFPVTLCSVQFMSLDKCIQLCVCVSLSVVSDSAIPWTVAHQAPLSMEFSRQEYWSGSSPLLQGIFPTQGSNLGHLHCRQILDRLSHQGSPPAVVL